MDQFYQLIERIFTIAPIPGALVMIAYMYFKSRAQEMEIKRNSAGSHEETKIDLMNSYNGLQASISNIQIEITYLNEVINNLISELNDKISICQVAIARIEGQLAQITKK